VNARSAEEVHTFHLEEASSDGRQYRGRSEEREEERKRGREEERKRGREEERKRGREEERKRG